MVSRDGSERVLSVRPPAPPHGSLLRPVRDAHRARQRASLGPCSFAFPCACSGGAGRRLQQDDGRCPAAAGRSRSRSRTGPSHDGGLLRGSARSGRGVGPAAILVLRAAGSLIRGPHLDDIECSAPGRTGLGRCTLRGAQYEADHDGSGRKRRLGSGTTRAGAARVLGSCRPRPGSSRPRADRFA
jgi:hypothetical protein